MLNRKMKFFLQKEENAPQILFHLFCVGNDNYDISSEEHFKNSKISKGSYLYLELFIFV
jgi:hypothetical protein